MLMAYGDGTFITNKSGSVTLQKYYGIDETGKKIYKKFTAKNKTTAKEMARQYEQSFISPNSIEVEKMTFIEYFKRWAELYKKNSVKATTYNAIEYCISSRIEPYEIARLQMKQLSSDIFQRYINTLVDAKYSRATIVKTYNTINNCLKMAETKGDIRVNPLRLVSIPSEAKVLTKEKEIEFFAEDDIKKLLNEAEQTDKTGKLKHLYGYEIIFLIYTGLRIGEACALCWKDIDLENKRMNIVSSSSIIHTNDGSRRTKEIISSPKTNKGKRTVFLTKQAIYALTKMREKNSKYLDDDDRVFITTVGTPLNRRNLRRSLNSLQKQANTSIQNSGLHVLRHTFATLAISKNIDLKTISQMLGHSKVSTTYNIYVHFIENNAIKALSALDNI